jgi:hypothetical protein
VAAWRVGLTVPAVAAELTARLPSFRRAGVPAAVIDAVATRLQPLGVAWLEGHLAHALCDLADAATVRQPALLLLAALGHDAAPAAARLRRSLATAPAAERWPIALALAACGESDLLAEDLAAAEPTLRAVAALAWQRSRHAELPAAAVVPFLTDQSRLWRCNAMVALPRVGQPTAAAAAAVVAQLDDDDLTQVAWQTLRQLGSRAAGAVLPLRQRLANGSDGREVELLAGMGPTAAAAAPAVLEWGLARPEHAWQAGAALARIAPVLALPQLLERARLEREQPPAGWWPSVQVLRGMGEAAAGEVGFLMHWLDDPAPATRMQALGVLDAMGPRALPALPKVLHVLQHDERDLVVWACYVVRSLGPAAAPAALPVLSKRLASEPDSHLRQHCFLAATGLGTEAEPLLVAALDEPVPDLTGAVPAALVALPSLQAATVTRLQAMLSERDDAARLRVGGWRCFERPLRERLGQGGSLSSEWYRLLERQLDHPGGGRGLARLSRVHHLAPTLWQPAGLESALLAISSDEVVAATANPAALAAWLRQVARTAAEGQRPAAVGALGQLGDVGEFVANLTCIGEQLAGPPSVRDAAIEALRSLGPRARASVPALRTLLAATPASEVDLLQRLVVALRAITAG